MQSELLLKRCNRSHYLFEITLELGTNSLEILHGILRGIEEWDSKALAECSELFGVRLCEFDCLLDGVRVRDCRDFFFGL